MAEGKLLLEGTTVDGKTVGADGKETEIHLVLPATSYLIDRSDLDVCNVDAARAERCLGELDACERKQCEAPREESTLEWLGWPVVISAVVVALAGGVALGVGIGVSSAPH